MIPLKYLSNFQRTLEMPLINCEVNVFLTQSEKCIIYYNEIRDYSNREPKFAITDTKLCVPVVTLLADDNKTILQKSKTGFKRTINWHKY